MHDGKRRDRQSFGVVVDIPARCRGGSGQEHRKFHAVSKHSRYAKHIIMATCPYHHIYALFCRISGRILKRWRNSYPRRNTTNAHGFKIQVAETLLYIIKQVYVSYAHCTGRELHYSYRIVAIELIESLVYGSHLNNKFEKLYGLSQYRQVAFTNIDWRRPWTTLDPNLDAVSNGRHTHRSVRKIHVC